MGKHQSAALLPVRTDPALELTKKQDGYVEMRAMGASEKFSAITVFGPKSGNTTDRLEKLPKIKQALINKQAANAYMLGLSRDTVLQGMLDAIDQAKMLADPMTQVAAWREVAKVCGFYAPEVKKIELSGPAQKVIDRMQQLSDEELAQIANAQDIEFVEVSDEAS